MADPVVLLESGQIYDRASLMQWFTQGRIRDPLTNLPMESDAVAPNDMLRGKIQTWKKPGTVDGGWCSWVNGWIGVGLGGGVCV